MKGQPNSQRLIDLIYAALLGESSWQSFLDELLEILPNGKALMLYHDAAAEGGAWQLKAGADPEADAAYKAYYAKINPWMSGATIRPVGRAVVADAMLPRKDLIRSEFYNDYLRPQDIQTGVGVTLRREGPLNFLLSVVSADVEEERALQAAACIQALVPHLQRAFEFYQRNERCASTLISAGGIGLHVGIIRIGSRMKVREANAIAQAIAERSGSFRADCGAQFKSVDPKLTDCVESLLLAWPRQRECLSARSFLVRHTEEGLPLRITVLAPSQDWGESFFRGPECILLVEDPQLDLGPAVGEIGTFYRLTSAEMRVLLALVNGLTLEQFAAGCGIAVGTARVQLKQVFAKTGVHRQADLVRLVCGLAANSLVGLYSAGSCPSVEQKPAKQAKSSLAVRFASERGCSKTLQS